MKGGSRLSALGSRLLVVGLVFAGAGVAPAQGQRAGGAPENRARLEGEIRRSFARAVRERVGLTDDQMQRLAPITRRHEQQRRELQIDERRARVMLQTELLKDAPDSTVVARQLEAMVGIHRRRTQLVESEHRDLATVMTVVQRARYFAVQEQFRRLVEQRLQGPPRDGGGAAGRRRPPPE